MQVMILQVGLVESTGSFMHMSSALVSASLYNMSCAQLQLDEVNEHGRL